MTAAVNRTHVIGVHPVHALLLGATLPLFFGGFLNDLAYSSSYEIQWSNFAAWLIAGAMVFTGFALAWALVDLVWFQAQGRRRITYLLLLCALFLFGLIDSLVHARDAWAVMPQGLILSGFVTLLAIVAIWMGYSVDSQGVSK